MRDMPSTVVAGTLLLAACDQVPTNRPDVCIECEDVTFDVPASPYDDALVKLARYTNDGKPATDFVEILDVAIHGRHVHLCTGTQSMLTIDRQAVGLPIIGSAISTIGHDKRCQHVAADGARLVITNRGDEYAPVPHVTVFDVTDPAQPIQVAATHSQDGTSYEGVAIVAPGEYAVGMHEGGVALLVEGVDAGAVTLTETTRIQGFANVWDVVTDGGWLYVADEEGVGVADLAAGVITGHLELPGTSKDVALGDGHLFVASGAAGVHVVDVDGVGVPTLVTTIDTPGSALMSAFSEGHLFIADWNDVRVFDVNTADAPRLVTTESIDVVGFPRFLAIGAADDHAYLGEWTGLYDYRLVDAGPAPDIGIRDPSLEFPTTPSGDVSRVTVAVKNEGDAPLVISTVHATPPFSVDVAALTIAPDEGRPLEVTFAPEDHALVDGQLTLVTDDPDEQLVTVALHGNHQALGAGDGIPDYAWTNLQDGQPIDMQGLRGSVVVLSYFATF